MFDLKDGAELAPNLFEAWRRIRDVIMSRPLLGQSMGTFDPRQHGIYVVSEIRDPYLYDFKLDDGDFETEKTRRKAEKAKERAEWRRTERLRRRMPDNMRRCNAGPQRWSRARGD